MNRDNQRKAESPHGHKGSSAALADAARLYIETHSSDKFSLQAMADALFVNGSYLLRAFRAYTGHTLLWYHNHIRCEKAKALLVDFDLSISKVGEEVGFVSSAHFAHVFKKMTGVTPTEYRLALKVDS